MCTRANKYPKQLIEHKINKFLENHKVDSNTFKQKQNQVKSRKQKLFLFHDSLPR